MTQAQQFIDQLFTDAAMQQTMKDLLQQEGTLTFGVWQAGFDSPEAGTVFYDEHRTTLDKRALRSQIGVVWQNSRIHAGSIYTNIVGLRPLPIEAAWDAARIAALEPLIRQMLRDCIRCWMQVEKSCHRGSASGF